MKKEKVLKIAFAVGSLVIMSFVVNIVIARGIQEYHIIMPRIGSTTTGRIHKGNATGAVNNNTSVGNNYDMYTAIRIADTGQDVTPNTVVGAGQRIGIPYYNVHQVVNQDTTLAASTAPRVLVRVEAHGSWSPDSN